MTRLFRVLLLLATAIAAGCVATPTTGKVEDPPNTLTPREIAGGWVLLFDGQTPFGWQVDGTAEVTGGTLALGGWKDTTAKLELGYAEFAADYRRDGHGEPEFDVWTSEGREWQFQGSTTLSFSPADGEGEWTTERWRVLPSPPARSGVSGSGGDLVFPPPTKTPTRRPLETTFGVDPGRPVRVQVCVPAGAVLYLRSVKYRPHGLEPLFDGKGLTGWKQVRAQKSGPEFAVTGARELHVGGGPAELRTERLYGDFVLQLEARTDGEGRGSVLFRGVPGRPGSGYEVPIRGPGQEGDGTGSIAGLQPAREVTAPAGEWVALTVVARANHLAVWVNGYQTADFTDTRPPAKDAREGSRSGKGPIRLRGQDVFFRNVRLVELAPGPK